MPRKPVQYRNPSEFETEDNFVNEERRGQMNYVRRPVSMRGIFVILLIVILLALGIWVGRSFGKGDPKGNSEFSAVYLSTGDVYFGKFSRFPSPRITNAWHLDRGVDKNNQPQVGLSAMKDVVWAPSDTLYLNQKEIVFWTRLRNDSPLIKTLSGETTATSPVTGDSGTGTAPAEQSTSTP